MGSILESAEIATSLQYWRMKRDPEEEGRPSTLLALSPDPSSMHLNEALADAEAQTSPSVLSADGAVQLLERLE